MTAEDKGPLDDLKDHPDKAATAAWDGDGAGGAETAVVAPVATRNDGPLLAYSDYPEGPDITGNRTWGETWYRALGCAVVGVLGVLAVVAMAADSRNPDAGLSGAAPPISAPARPSVPASAMAPTVAAPEPMPPTPNVTPPATASSPVPAHQLSGDAWYLAMVNTGLDPIGMSVKDPAGSISDGHRVCNYIASVHSVPAAVDEVVAGLPTTLPPERARTIATVVVNAAVKAYCPGGQP